MRTALRHQFHWWKMEWPGYLLPWNVFLVCWIEQPEHAAKQPAGSMPFNLFLFFSISKSLTLLYVYR